MVMMHLSSLSSCLVTRLVPSAASRPELRPPLARVMPGQDDIGQPPSGPAASGKSAGTGVMSAG